MGIFREVENKFRQIANSCIGYRMCSKIGTIQPEDYVVSKRPYELGPPPIYYKSQEKKPGGESLLKTGNNETKLIQDLEVGYSDWSLKFYKKNYIYN